MKTIIKHLIFSGEKGTRLDKHLNDEFPDLSRNQIQNLIKQGLVYVNQEKAKKNGQPLEVGHTITVHLPVLEPSIIQPEAIPLEIRFENRDLLVVNKPAGMVVHPAYGHGSGTLIHALLSYLPTMADFEDKLRPGIVHRLDKSTSGLILVAKNLKTKSYLQDQFRNRIVKKLYLALVDSQPPTPEGRIEAPIGRDPANRKKMAIVKEDIGRNAVTEYFTKQQFAHHTFLEVHPLTGRTHQIRVHLAFLNCPVVGDRLYGYRKPSLDIQHHFLHAHQLEITLPGNSRPTIFEAPLPLDLENLLTELKRQPA